MVADTLSFMIAEAVEKKELKGKSESEIEGPPFFLTFFFADDSLIFHEATLENCKTIKRILKEFGEATGEEVNYQKPEIAFSPNTPISAQNEIMEEMGMGAMKEAAKYLGLPTSGGRILAKLQGWKQCTLSPAGKEILMKDIATSIPSFPMTCFKFPAALCRKISSNISRFWWGEKERGGKIHWLHWDALTESKEVGGLGFRDLKSLQLGIAGKNLLCI